MRDTTVSASVDACLVWDYDVRLPRLRALYHNASAAQWSPAEIDWSVAVPFGASLPEDSEFAMASFRASPLAARGRRAWDEFRWELQAWMVSQFLHGEQAALLVAARLVETLPDLDAKLCAASQVVDEARHVEVFSRYLREKVPVPYDASPPLHELLTELLADSRWDIVSLGMQIVVEGLAMAAFRMADSTFHDALIKDIVRRVGRDEARHVSFGVLSLDGIYPQLTSAELAEREDLVLTAAELTRRRFLLADIWERMGLPAAQGMEYARSDALMVQYRRVIFGKLAATLTRIGLFGPRVRAGLTALDLYRPR